MNALEAQERLPSLHGRRILISGGGSGIGAAIAEACAGAGARVGVIGRDPGRLEQLAQRIGAATATADISIRASAEQAVSSVAEQLGGLDGLINNAGAMLHSKISAGRSDDWRTMLDVNVLGLLHVTHAALDHLRQADHADIVNISSIAADRVSLSDFAIYSATKASVLRITEALRMDLANDGDIRVAVVKPGAVNTSGFGPGVHDPELRKRVEAIKQTAAMQPDVLAAEICHVLALPRAACIAEIVIIPHRP